MSDYVQPDRWQPTRLPHPWDSPGKNTGVGCHFLLQCMKVKSESEVAQSCLTLRNPMDCNLPGSSVHGIFHGEEKVKSENCNHFQTNPALAECGLKQGMTMKHSFIYWGLFFLSKVRNFLLTWEVL